MQGQQVLTLFKQTPSASLPYFQTKVGDFKYIIEQGNFDQFSIAFMFLTIEHQIQNKNYDIPKISQFYQNRITYLSEQLRLVEWDKLSDIGQIRSQKPYQTPSKMFFYEALIKTTGKIKFLRYEYDKISHKKIPIQLTLTFDIFTRLVDDLSEGLTI